MYGDGFRHVRNAGRKRNAILALPFLFTRKKKCPLVIFCSYFASNKIPHLLSTINKQQVNSNQTMTWPSSKSTPSALHQPKVIIPTYPTMVPKKATNWSQFHKQYHSDEYHCTNEKYVRKNTNFVYKESKKSMTSRRRIFSRLPVFRFLRKVSPENQ